MSWGLFLYVFVVVLLYYFYRSARALDHEACFDHDTETHHRVHAMLKAHPKGGTWRQVTAWLAEAGEPDTDGATSHTP